MLTSDERLAAGNLCLARGQLAEAAICYRQALASDVGGAGAWGNLGECLRRQGKLREAELILIEGLSLHRDAPALLHNLAVVLEAKGELDAAERVCRRLLSLVPSGHEGAFNTLGTIAFRLQAFAAAETWWRQALVLNPGNADGHCNLAIALWRQRRLEAAEACLNTALAIAPDLARAIETLGLVRRQAGGGDEALPQ